MLRVDSPVTPASDTAPGTVELATNAEAQAVTSQTLATTPGNLAAVFAAPPALGSTTPAAVTAAGLTVSSGQAKIQDGTQVAPGLAGVNFANYGIRFTTGWTSIVTNSGDRVAVGSLGQLQVGSGGIIAFSSTTSPSATPDTILARDAANIWAQRNGTAAQVWRVYSTFTDASNYERLGITTQTGNATTILQEQAGTGAPRHLGIGTTGAAAVLRLMTTNVTRWEVAAAGHLNAAADNTYDIGASGATRPRDAHIARNVIAAAGATVGSSSAPAASAALEVVSTTKGLLLPRMTSTERDAISSPAAGLMIYNTTTNKLNVFTTAWEAVTSA